MMVNDDVETTGAHQNESPRRGPLNGVLMWGRIRRSS
jgi:hypothetical protein